MRLTIDFYNMQEVINIPVSLTPSAIEELKNIRIQENIPAEKLLRIGAKGGGCSGLTYVLDFDEKQTFDEEYEVDGLKLIVDQRHALYLQGMEVDYQNGLNDRGFIFNNPNASSTCGCGTSFAV
jgi:iron-sulfur cluster assembly protein